MNTNTLDAHKQPQDPAKPWKGYTIDELRYQQAYTAVRMQIDRQKLFSTVSQMRGGMMSLKGTGLLGRMLSNLSYVDYAFMAFRIGRQEFRLFRRR